MTQNAKRKLTLLRKQIDTSQTITDRDREKLLAFEDRLALLQSEYDVKTRYKLLEYCAIMAGQSQEIPQEELPNMELSAVLSNREAAEDLVRWVHDRYDNEESNASYRRAIRTFGKHMTEGEGLPETVEWIPTTLSSTYDPAPEPADMLTWEDDVIPMINACLNPRDKALIAVAWDAGPRGSELYGLTVEDVTDHKYGFQITVRGKTGKRTVTLIPSAYYLQQWLTAHPGRDSPSTPLWSNLRKPEKVSYETLWKAITRAGERANVTKPVHFTNFRKSSASFLASKGMNQAHIEDHHGWVPGSTVASRYVSIFGDAAENELARIHGHDVPEDETESIGPLTCPRCQHEIPRHEEFCVWCGQALDHEALQTVKEREREVRDAVFRLAQKDPEILAERQRIDDLITLTEEHPDLLDEAEHLLEVLG